jgi:hypothetical protein
MPKRIILDTYDDEHTVYSSTNNNGKEQENETPIKKESLWDVIKNRVKKVQNRKKEENEFKDSIRQEAKEEAKVEVVPILKEKYKQEEIDRLTGKNKGDMLEKFKNAMVGTDGKFLASDEKIDRMLGRNRTSSTNELESKKKDNNMSGGNMLDNDKLLSMMGRNKDRIKKEPYTTGISNDDILSKISLSGGKNSNKNAISDKKIKKHAKLNKKNKNSKVVGDDKIKHMISNSDKSVEDKIKEMLK